MTTDSSNTADYAASPLENEDDLMDDDDSMFGGRMSNYTVSLSSSVVDYPEEYGRRYHAFRSGSYVLPNDKIEIDRLDMAHAMMVKAIGNRLFLAPLDRRNVKRILDTGTGTGIWAIEMGDIFENAEVVGVDLSNIQPTWVPPNVKFKVDDVESPWVEDRKFDFIFCRFMAASIADWPRLMENIYDHLQPGGWAEFHEMDPEVYSDVGSYTRDHVTWSWNQTFLEVMRISGRDPCPGPQVEVWAKQVGFKSTFHQKLKIPLGPWPKSLYYQQLGSANLAQMLERLEGFTLRAFCGILGRSEADVLAQVEGVRREMTEGAYNGAYDM
ncbi:Secondary metabolism regulator LAE1 [Colletotrichum fructicola]|nr:Secondary metabolism regulator LAE1 [Colletotrichum fructicola]KAF4895396.1 Secondary metabolism regulator LAE1 [Colletotrichum fructicola]KAF4928407.1 Secondary metabolism regulator LAE1 [Colletotrichum fructicola]